MTVVSNDPSSWSSINFDIYLTYWIVAAGVVVVYDWVLTLGQEVELIWSQRCSLMTLLYLGIRYIGILYSIAKALINMPLVSLTDAGCNILNYTTNGTAAMVTVMLGVIMIARLHAMYQRSRIMLIFLVIIFLAVNIACEILAVIVLKHFVGEELILSGAYMCSVEYEGDAELLFSMVWVLNTAWEVLVLLLSLWIAMKHFRDLRRFGPSTGSTMGDCFRVLIKSHVLYFASFVCVSCLDLSNLSPELANSNSAGAYIFDGALQISFVVQLFVLGPRLILSVREYHAELVADTDTETGINSIVFQERVHVPTSSTV